MTQKTKQLLYALFTLLVLKSASANPVIVPLQLAGRLLIVDVTVNEDQHGAFILDTGSSSLILNGQYFRGRTLPGDNQIVGLNGNVDRIEFQTVDLRLGHLEWKNIDGAIVNLAHLERKCDKVILGLLGTSALKHLELQIDFGRLQLVFYPLDKNGNRLNPPFAELPPTEVFPLQFENKIPCLLKQYGGRTFKLALDCASEANIFHKGLYPFLEQCLADAREHGFRGVDGQIRKAVHTKLRGFTLGSAAYLPMPTLFASLHEFNAHLLGPRLDGILGFEFFKQFKTAINFRKKELYIWNHRTSGQTEELLVNACE